MSHSLIQRNLISLLLSAGAGIIGSSLFAQQPVQPTNGSEKGVAVDPIHDDVSFDSLKLEIKSTLKTNQEEVRSELGSDSLSISESSEAAKELIRDAKVGANQVMAQKKHEYKEKSTNLLSGDGITTDNANEKLGTLINDPSLSDVSEITPGVDLHKANLATPSLSALSTNTEHIIKDPSSQLSKTWEGVTPEQGLDKVTEVFSDTQLQLAYDSLLTRVDWNVVNALLRDPNAVSNSALLEAVFIKFPGLNNVSRMKQDASIISSLAGGTDPVRVLSSLAAVHLHDLPKMQLGDSALAQLPNLRGGILDKQFLQYSRKYWNRVDSLRNINLKQTGLKLKERKLSSLTNETVFKDRFGFLNKIYVEGIIGIFNGAWNGNVNLFQFSPALGYHLLKDFSVGLGPNLVLQEQQKKLILAMGMRSFIKYELLKYNIYFQLEDNMMFPRVDRSNIEGRKVETQHAVMGGGGYILPLSKRIALNLNLMYRMAATEYPGLSGSSPWVYRIGISSRSGNQNLKKP